MKILVLMAGGIHQVPGLPPGKGKARGKEKEKENEKINEQIFSSFRKMLKVGTNERA